MVRSRFTAASIGLPGSVEIQVCNEDDEDDNAEDDDADNAEDDYDDDDDDDSDGDRDADGDADDDADADAGCSGCSDDDLFPSQ